ncbi:MAG TPA: hypothetical protein VGW38_27000, partial [Chloroflexota bacterium]|nr:hypothetical protein [Chloroflexota bacterium]
STFVDGTLKGENGVVYEQCYGFALERQHFPDSPNQPNVPSIILQPGTEYRSHTILRFSVGGHRCTTRRPRRAPA